MLFRSLKDPSQIADNIASHITATISEKQQIFETVDVKKRLNAIIKILQDMICFDIEEIEKNKKKFISKHWERSKKKDEGGGEYRILENGKVFEKVGVNFSEVYGKFSSDFRKKIPGTNSDPNFWASGISIVMHMKNPHIPAMHFNTRYIHTSFGWFGGGMDVTPSFEDNTFVKEKYSTTDFFRCRNSYDF